MKKGIFALIVTSTLLMAACNPETGILTVSGNVDPGLSFENPKVGLFPVDQQFSGDGVFIYYDSQTSDPSVVPLVIAVPDASGNYSIDFPSDPTSVGQMVAWDDILDNGEFDIALGDPDEPGFFPLKDITGITDPVVINGWSIVGDILFAVEDSEVTTLFSLEDIGAGGFDFYDY